MIIQNKMKIRSRFLIPFAFLSIFVNGCVSSNFDQSEINKDVCTACGYELSDAQITELSVQASKGDGQASLRLSQYYEFANFDYEQHLYWLKKSAEQGNALAKYNYSVFLLDSKDKSNQSIAFKYLNELAADDDIDAQYQLAKLYINGIGTTKNIKNGCEILNKLKMLGHNLSSYELKSGVCE